MLIQKEFILSFIFISLMSDKFYKLMMHWHKAGFVFWSCVKSACSKGFLKTWRAMPWHQKTPQSFEKACIPRRAHNLWSIWLPSNHQTLWLGYIIFHLTISPYLVLFDKEPSMTLCFADKAIDVAAFFRTSPYHPLLTIGARRRAIYKHQCLGRSTQTVLPASRHEKNKRSKLPAFTWHLHWQQSIHWAVASMCNNSYFDGSWVSESGVIDQDVWHINIMYSSKPTHRNSASLRTDLTRSLIGFRELQKSSASHCEIAAIATNVFHVIALWRTIQQTGDAIIICTCLYW